MLLQDDAIEICLSAAINEYETNNIELLNAEFDPSTNQWYVTFRVWEWLKVIWKAWEGDAGKIYYAVHKDFQVT